ncbi:adenylate/guanylate cyclase domain-containing protein [Reyranella sp.]|uniref:adenylate/guanylate cyclase domain-containing protein n=1 Tax=Reyranella sp. TaxID=1929291 RepID=UPI0025F9CAE2|nr:adenylate/guanylate cyclase domain-containing protein [Reyranella sp.]
MFYGLSLGFQRDGTSRSGTGCGFSRSLTLPQSFGELVEAPRLERRLVAILAADVEGYSRHMEHDEAGTLATLSNHRLIFDGLIVSHQGRITNTAGDSVLAEFQSVVDAVDCAMRVQDGLAAANEMIDDAQRLHFRIGINVGDVMVKDGDIFGDGVNIAARLESLAQAGGICVSRGVRDHLRKMGQYAFEDLGEQTVKNIAQPIRAFRVRKATDVGHPVSPLPAEPKPTGEPPEFELAFWEAMKDSEDPGEFAAYLEKYPTGAFATLAEARRHSLLETQDEPPPSHLAQAVADPEQVAIELAFWDSVKDSDNPAMYEAYLERYPEGAFSPLAQVRLEELGESDGQGVNAPR